MTDVRALRDSITGSVIEPADHGYDRARAFHSGAGTPDLIVRPASLDDIAAAIRYADEASLPIVVRGGGHSTWGAVPGGMTIDLAGFGDVEVEGTLVRVGGGAVWRAVAQALAPLHLGLSSGDTASVGVGGLTLGGGIGWMVRAWGLALDQLVGLQLVTAAGDVLEVDADSHPELFWALRGGGGNFGVVTRFDFRAHELPGVVFGPIHYEGDARLALRALRETMRTASDELTVTFLDVPEMDPHAPSGAAMIVCWAGTDELAARKAVAPLLALDGVTGEEIAVRRYPDILMDPPAIDPSAAAPTVVDANALLRELDDETIDALVGIHEKLVPSVLLVRTLGGAFGRVQGDSTAFPVRDAAAFAMAATFAAPGADPQEIGRLAAALAPVWELGDAAYGNFSNANDGSVVGRIYSPAGYARLAAVKRQWDPGNRFSRNHNVVPR